MEDQDMKKVFSKSHEVSLSPEERAHARAAVMNFVVKNPLTFQPVQGQQPRWVFFASMLAARPVAKYATLAVVSLMTVVFFGAGVSVAANNALPGEFLYSVKTEFTERLVRLAIIDDSAKANYDISLLQKRLQEAEQISSKNRLDALTSNRVQALVSIHIADAKSGIRKIKQQQGVGAGLVQDTELQASLNAHAEVLGALSQKTTPGEAEGIKSLAVSIDDQAATMREEQQDERIELFAKDAATVRDSANIAMQKAQSLQVQVAAFIESKKADVSVSTYKKAMTDLDSVTIMVLDGKAALEAGDYNNAFILLQNAVGTAKQIKIYIQNQALLRAQLPLETVNVIGF